MNCDTAFELITDPQGCHSAVLREHLAGCPRCRQMRETLLPALEALADEGECIDSALESRPYSGDWAEAARHASAESIAVAQQAAQTLAQPCRFSRGFWRQWTRKAARYAAAFAVGACAAFLLLPRVANDSGRQSAAAVPVSDGHCIRQRLKTDADGMSDAEVRQLVLSCMVCHVPVR